MFRSIEQLSFRFALRFFSPVTHTLSQNPSSKCKFLAATLTHTNADTDTMFQISKRIRPPAIPRAQDCPAAHLPGLGSGGGNNAGYRLSSDSFETHIIRLKGSKSFRIVPFTYSLKIFLNERKAALLSAIPLAEEDCHDEKAPMKEER